MRLSAKKSLGQHFLNSKHVLDQIIMAAKLQKGEAVLEIGPGTGALTEALLEAGARVIAIEKDDRAYALLQDKFIKEIENGGLTLVRGDILHFESDMSERSVPDDYSIVANIPYYITGAILEKFLEKGPRPSRMVLLVQKEVADRIVARDGKESVLSISVKAFGVPKIIATVPPGAFTPPPTVDSAILQINEISGKRFEKRALQMPFFFTLVKTGFAHKRKILKSNLSAISSTASLEHVWEELHLDEKVRAEDVPLDTWFDLATKLATLR